MAKKEIIQKRRNLADIQKELMAKGELVTKETCKTMSELRCGRALLDARIRVYPEYPLGEHKFDFN